MPKYKIGITEAGDAGLDLSWVDKLSSVDGAVVITKCVSPSFHKAVIDNGDRLIVHATVTGYGRTVVEPIVPPPYESYDAIMSLVQDGFPKEKIVIRVDPIIPTPKGIAVARNVIMGFIDGGFSRFRVSIIDMYPHVRDRFMASMLPLPYGNNGFSPSKSQVLDVNSMIADVSEYWTSHNKEKDNTSILRVESCAEPDLTNAIQCGCISKYDLDLLGLDTDCAVDEDGNQRKHCLCYSGKKELLKHKTQCQHGCLYCYWR